MRHIVRTLSSVPSRRTVLAGLGGALAAGATGTSRAGPASLALFAGGYNRQGGRGVLPLAYDIGADRWRTGAPVATAPNTSFSVRSSRSGLHHLVQEQRDGRLLTFHAGADCWRALGSVPTLGDDPCHLAPTAPVPRWRWPTIQAAA